MTVWHLESKLQPDRTVWHLESKLQPDRTVWHLVQATDK